MSGQYSVKYKVYFRHMTGQIEWLYNTVYLEIQSLPLIERLLQVKDPTNTKVIQKMAVEMKSTQIQRLLL